MKNLTPFRSNSENKYEQFSLLFEYKKIVTYILTLILREGNGRINVRGIVVAIEVNIKKACSDIKLFIKSILYNIYQIQSQGTYVIMPCLSFRNLKNFQCFIIKCIISFSKTSIHVYIYIGISYINMYIY